MKEKSNIAVPDEKVPVLVRRTTLQKMESAIALGTAQPGFLPSVKKTPSSVKTSANIEKVLHHWNSKSYLRKIVFPKTLSPFEYGNPSRIFCGCITAIRRLTTTGTFYSATEFSKEDRKFEADEIIRVIDVFHLVATDPKYFPTNKKPMHKISFVEFLYNKFSAYEKYRSCFMSFLKEPPQPRNISINEMPEMKNHRFCKAFEKQFLLTFRPSSTPEEISFADKVLLITSANRAFDMLGELEQKRLFITPMLTDYAWAARFMDAILEWSTYSESTVTPMTLTKDFIFNIFESWLVRRGTIMGPEEDEEEPDEEDYGEEALYDWQGGTEGDFRISGDFPGVVSEAVYFKYTEELWADKPETSQSEKARIEMREWNDRIFLAEQQRSFEENKFET